MPSILHCALVNGTESLLVSSGGYVMHMSPVEGWGVEALGKPNGNVGLWNKKVGIGPGDR